MRAGLSKEEFIGSRAIIAALVDASRILVYSSFFFSLSDDTNPYVIILAAVSSMIGSNVGNRISKRITMTIIQHIVAVSLIVFACFLALGKL